MTRKAARNREPEQSTHGDRTAWDLFHLPVQRFLQSRLSNPADAEELLQETFLRLHRTRPRINGERRIRAWLFRTARNLLVDHYRTTRDLLPLADDTVDESMQPATPLAELESCLNPLSANLPEIYRSALQMDLDGIPQATIARAQNLSLSGAKSRVQRARQLLLREFERCCRFSRDEQGNLLDYRERSCPSACQK